MSEQSPLAELLRATEDLNEVSIAVGRERAIRQVMAETGESREIVAEMADAIESMSREEVLSLTEGKPTTLEDGLRRYVRVLEELDGDYHLTADEVTGNLTTLLAYPWPGNPQGVTCEHGTAVIRETPSAFEGAAPVRTYEDGCQSFGPYPAP